MLTTRLVVAFLAASLVTLGGTSSAQETDKKVAKAEQKATKERQEIDSTAQEALDELLSTVDGATALYERAAGYAAFRVTKAGLGIGGAGGKGVAVNKSSGDRVYMKMGAGSIGFTVGVNRYDIVILFETPDKLKAFSTGGWDSGATAQAAAGSAGAGATASFHNGVAYYQISDKGLMASADVSGTKFWVDDDLN